VFRALRAENIGVNVHYIPVHMHPYYRDRFGYKGGEYPVAEAAYEQLISLPMFHGMTDEDVEDVIHAVGKVATAFAEQSNSVGQFVGTTVPTSEMITEDLV
jgi:perosamine synthetase